MGVTTHNHPSFGMTTTQAIRDFTDYRSEEFHEEHNPHSPLHNNTMSRDITLTPIFYWVGMGEEIVKGFEYLLRITSKFR